MCLIKCILLQCASKYFPIYNIKFPIHICTYHHIALFKINRATFNLCSAVFRISIYSMRTYIVSGRIISLFRIADRLFFHFFKRTNSHANYARFSVHVHFLSDVWLECFVK